MFVGVEGLVVLAAESGSPFSTEGRKCSNTCLEHDKGLGGYLALAVLLGFHWKINNNPVPMCQSVSADPWG